VFVAPFVKRGIAIDAPKMVVHPCTTKLDLINQIQFAFFPSLALVIAGDDSGIDE